MSDSKPLPTPEQRPDADVVIFDGNCRFCTGQVQRLQRWDGKQRLAFVSLHDPLVSQRWPDLTYELLMEQMYVVDGRDNRYGGAAAFRYLTRRLPRLWLLAPLLHIPGSLWLWQWIYRRVAARRYQISGKADCDEDSCKVHLRS